MQDGHVLVWRDHVDMVRMDFHPVLRLKDLHGCDAREQLWQDAFVSWVEMGHEHKSQSGIVWHVLEELLKSLQRAGRPAHSHDVEGLLLVVLVAALSFGREAGDVLMMLSFFGSLSSGFMRSSPFLESYSSLLCCISSASLICPMLLGLSARHLYALSIILGVHCG